MAAEIVFNCILGLFIAVYLAKVLRLPDLEDTLDTLGASGFPQIIGVLALLLLVLLTVRALRSKSPVDLPLLDIKRAEGRLLLLNIALLAGYIILLNILGFAVSTILYMFIAASSFGYDKWTRLTLFSAIASVALVIMFGTVFYVPLPRGIGIFRELSFLVY